jgi:hypothetical protein
MEESTRQQLETRVARLEQQIRAFKELHASELGLILDELASLRADLQAMAAPLAESEPRGTPADPAAASPKRAAWLAEEERKEQQRRAPLSRREFLRGRDNDEGKSGRDDVDDEGKG